MSSAERDGATPIDQAHWGEAALDTFGQLFGGATAFPRATGVWRDDERGGVLIKDEPVVIHGYTTPADIADSARLSRLGEFCRRTGREARQGEIGLVIGDEYLAFRDFSGERVVGTPLDIDRIAKDLGAVRRGKVVSRGGYFGAVQLAAGVSARFRVPDGGGRPTDPSWGEQRLIRLSTATLEQLGHLAEKAHATPMQVAALLLERAAQSAAGQE